MFFLILIETAIYTEHEAKIKIFFILYEYVLLKMPIHLKITGIEFENYL